MKKKPQAIVPAAKPAEVVEQKTASVRPLATGIGPVPVAPSAERVQLTPVIQPVAFVPYSTQDQPMYTFERGIYEMPPQAPQPYSPYGQQPFQQQYPYAAPVAAEGYDAAVPAKKKFNVWALLIIILAVALVAFVVLPKFIELDNDVFAITVFEEQLRTGGTYIDNFLDMAPKMFDEDFVINDFLEPASVVLAAVFAVFVLFFSLFRFKKQGMGFWVRFFSFLMLASAGIIGYLAFKNDIIGIGAYIVVGLAFVIFAIALLVKTAKRKKA